MMHNKNIYKKLCTATISLGLLFSIGQFAYAHDQSLKVVETFVRSKPTIEHLTLLRSLYEIDIQQHYAKGQIKEAIEAEQKLQKTQAQINSILAPAKHEDNLKYQIEAAEESANRLALFIEKSKLTHRTDEQYETLAQCWDALAELAQSHPTYSQNVLEYQIKAAKAKASQLDIIGRHNTTAEQYEALAQRWDAVVELAQSHSAYPDRLLGYQIEAAEARVAQQQKIISQNGITPNNCKTLAKRHNKLSKLYNSCQKYKDAITCKWRARNAMLCMAKSSENHEEKCNAYKKVVKYNDDQVTIAERAGDSPYYNVLDLKIKAAKSRIKLAKTILERESTLENYDNWVRCCEELVQLFDGNDHDGLKRVAANRARIKLAEAMDAAMIRQSTFLSIAALLGRK